MPSALKPLVRLARASFLAQARYLPAAVGGFVANSTFGFLKGAVLTATVAAAGGTVAGYDLPAMAAYVWLSQGLLGVLNLSAESPIGERVKSGDVAIDLIRPLNVLAANIAEELGRSLFQIPVRLLPALLVGALATSMVLPSTLAPYLLGALAVLLGTTISAACRFALNVIAFWIVETRGLRILYLVGSTFLAGLYTPISLFPDWLRVVAECTPFPSILQAPVDIISGRITGGAAASTVGVQALWLLGALALGALLFHRGRVKLELQGG